MLNLRAQMTLADTKK